MVQSESTMQIDWKESYKIGHAMIDEEHQQAFVLANNFLAAKGQQAQRNVAIQLYKHTREHFEHEEALMREVAFPDYRAHVEGHTRLITRLNVISHSVGRNDLNQEDLRDLMTDWALNHIAQDDARLAAFVTTR